MSLFDNLAQEVSSLEGGNASGESPILGHVMDLVNNPQTGGLQGLVQQFQNNGLGEVVNSWIGNGNNQPISGDQIAQVIGQDKVNEIAGKLRMDPNQISSLIANHLPGVIDKLTPQGQAN